MQQTEEELLLSQSRAVQENVCTKLDAHQEITLLCLNQQSEYKVFYKLMCWVAGSLTCRLTSVMRSPPARRSRKDQSLLIDFWLLVYEVSISHTTTHHSRQDSSGQVVSPSQRPLPDNRQHSQQTDIHAPGVIRTHDFSRRATVDLCLRPRSQWDRLNKT